MDPDSSGFAEFYESSKDACLRAVYASVGDLPLAEDLTAEAFARAWARWRTVGRHGAPRAWVVRTALNAGVSRWRHHRREVAVAATEITAARDRAATPATDGPQTTVDPALMTALQGLPPRQRQVIALRVFLDLDTAATARALGIAPGTVTAHLARAIAALRAQFPVPIEQE